MAGRRIHERYERRLKVIVSHPGGKLECVSRNISLGGILLATDSPLPYGTQVKLSMFLPALKEDAVIDGVVRWQRDEGMGVQFGSLRARDVWALNQLFKDAPIAAD
ncbi:MAG: PilZ domain-containing protein [Sandaracinaceae bacterium]|nr:PilZ domain-containing protein [Sandaracinaceae bacterium]MCC6873854.1 PilZ domain-containing protein [Sandaracinaceae bacterium]